jgi:hypothetical protein
MSLNPMHLTIHPAGLSEALVRSLVAHVSNLKVPLSTYSELQVVD